jgi:hypothetical protein
VPGSRGVLLGRERPGGGGLKRSLQLAWRDARRQRWQRARQAGQEGRGGNALRRMPAQQFVNFFSFSLLLGEAAAQSFKGLVMHGRHARAHGAPARAC